MYHSSKIPPIDMSVYDTISLKYNKNDMNESLSKEVDKKLSTTIFTFLFILHFTASF